MSQGLPRVHWNTTDYNNTFFETTRERDIWRDEYLRQKEKETIELEKASMDDSYVKPNRRYKNLDKNLTCYTYDYWDDDPKEDGCMVHINETVNLKANESSIFVASDVFDRGKKGCRQRFKPNRFGSVWMFKNMFLYAIN